MALAAQYTITSSPIDAYIPDQVYYEGAPEQHFQRYLETNIFHSSGIDTSGWDAAFSRLSEGKEISHVERRILSRVAVMTTARPGNSNHHLCDHPTIITNGAEFTAAPQNYFKTLGIAPTESFDKDITRSLVLRTTILPSNAVNKAMGFGMSDALAVIDAIGNVRYYRLNSTREEIVGQELEGFLQNLNKNVTLVSAEEPARQKGSIHMCTCCGSPWEVGNNVQNSRVLIDRAKSGSDNKKECNIEGVQINIYKFDGGDFVSEEKLMKLVREAKKIEEYLKSLLGFREGDELALDIRYYPSIQPSDMGMDELQLFDFNFKKARDQNLCTALSPGIDHTDWLNDRDYLELHRIASGLTKIDEPNERRAGVIKSAREKLNYAKHGTNLPEKPTWPIEP